MRLVIFFLLCFAAFMLLMSRSDRTTYLASLNKQATLEIYIVKHGWHAGVVIPVSGIPEGLLPEKWYFGKARFLEIGWGDSGFYQADVITTSLTANALLLPTRSVVHVVGFSYPVERNFYQAGIVKIRVSKKRFKELIRFIHNSIDRGGENVAMAFKKGRYGHSFFFRGRGSYHVFRTCNKWTAEAVRKAGVPVHTFYVATSGSIMSQVRDYGEVLR